MTKYNLEEFKIWLENNQSKWEASTTRIDWKSTLEFIKKEKIFDFFVEGKNNVNVSNGNFTVPGWKAYVQVAQQWLTDREKERLTKKAEDQKQRILALEADKTDLINQLAQAKQKHQDYLRQEKAFLQRGIQLIKEVLHD